MRILALDSALARCSATIVSSDNVVAGRQADLGRGHASVLTVMARDVLDEASIRPALLDLVAVTVGPGGFTGIRAAIALAMGIGTAASVPVVAVTVGEALADALPFLGGRTLWCAIQSRRDRVFLEIGEVVLSLSVTELPTPDRPVAIAGAAALDVASRLASTGADVMLTDARVPLGRHVAQVAERRWHGRIRPLPVAPLYVDPPAVKVPASGVRSTPVG